VTDHNPAAVSALAGVKWPVKRLRSGKFRRYHGRSFSGRIFDFGTLLRNLADLFAFGLGLVQSVWLMMRWRPDVVFINGGSIGVPVAWVARLFGRPYLIHESDTKTGLANRLIAPGSRRILLGLPGEGWPQDGRHFVTGIPLRPNFLAAKRAGGAAARRKLKLPKSTPIVLVTGGSQGAAALNRAMLVIAPQLVGQAYVVHLAGARNAKRLKAAIPPRGYRLLGFVGAEMADYLAAADVVVSRAGASTLADLAFFAKPAIIIPNPLLVGGHQLTNAELFANNGAAVVLGESDVSERPQRLLGAINRLLDDKSEQRRLSGALATLAQPQATKQIAGHIMAVGRGQ